MSTSSEDRGPPFKEEPRECNPDLNQLNLSYMFLQLAHTKTPVFSQSKSFTLECYRIKEIFRRMKDLRWCSKSEGQLFPFT